MTKNPEAKITERVTQYAELENRGQTVVLSMTGNLSFPTPSPDLATIQSAVTDLSEKITAWGTPGNRGSRLDLANLRVAATNLRNLLVEEAAYVMNQVDLNTDVPTQVALILSAGFEIRNMGSPQGPLQAPQRVRQLVQSNLSNYTPKIKWAKPLGVTVRSNVKVYNIFRATTNNFAAATYIGLSTKTEYIDMTAPRGTTLYYFVIAVNNFGNGVPSEGVTVLIPN